MSEALLFIVILLLIGYIFYLNYRHEKQVNKLLDRVMARSLSEVKEVEAAPVKLESPKPPEFVELSQLSDDEFDKAIAREVEPPSKGKTLMEQFKKKIAKGKK